MKKLSTLILLFIFIGCQSEQPVTLPKDKKVIAESIADTTVTISHTDSLIAQIVAISVKNAVDIENNRWGEHGNKLLSEANKILRRLNSGAIDYQQAIIQLSELFRKINYPLTHR